MGSPHTRTLPLIAHIIFRLDFGGLENGLVNLVNGLSAEEFRHTIICLTDFTAYRERIIDGQVEVHALNKREGKDPGAYCRLWKLLRRLRPDVVHTRNLGTLDCAVIARMASVRHTVHGEHGWDVMDLYGNSRKYKLVRRACRPFVQRYITLSQDLSTFLCDRIGVPEARIRQIYNGVDTDLFRPRAGPRPSGQFVIGTVGRMQTVKNQLDLVRAFVEVAQRSRTDPLNLRLVMIGDGPLREAAQGMLADAGMAELAWLPGTRSDIAEQMAQMDLFVLPSLNEGISNTILEAMACGVPVIATRVGGNPELVIDGETGTLVPASSPSALADAIQIYMENLELAHMHGEVGRRRVESHFSMHAMLEGYRQVYHELLLAERA